MRVAYVIVDWRTPRLAAAARESILARRPLAAFVTIDAARLDLSYAEACNAGAEALGERADVLCFLNADVEMLEPDLPVLDLFAADPDLAVVGPRQLNAVDRIAHGGVVPYEDGTEWDLYLRHRCWLWPLDAESDEMTSGTFEVPFVPGSTLYVRREHLEAVGGWPTFSRFYYEDTGLCWAVRARGWRVLFTGAVTWRHFGEGSPLRPDDRSRRMEVAHRAFATWCQEEGLPLRDIPLDAVRS